MVDNERNFANVSVRLDTEALDRIDRILARKQDEDQLTIYTRSGIARGALLMGLAQIERDLFGAGDK